jgi:outer membrane protein assembly factor BamB
VTAAAIVVGECVLFGTLSGYFYCLDKNDGDLVAHRKFKKEIRYPAASDGRFVYVISGDGTVHACGD